MKRLFVGGAVLGILVMVLVSFAAEVTSVNVVGYKKVDLPAGGILMVGMNFDAFDATLLGVFGTNQLSQGTSKSSEKADKIYVWDPNLGVSGGYGQYGQKDDGLFYELGAWSGTATNPALVAGMGLWLSAGTGTTGTNEIVLMGEAVDVQTQAMDIVQGFQMIAYPFSSDIDLQDTDFFNDGAAVGTAKSSEKADKMYVWDGKGYGQYGLKDDGSWYELGDWSGSPAAKTLTLAQGFWYAGKTNFLWDEGNKYLDNLTNP